MTNTMQFNDDNALLCPECGFEYTHLEQVVMYARPAEDLEATAIMVDHTGLMSATAHPGLRRRTAIEIRGRCENGHAFEIHLVQHKGQTLLT